MNPNNDRGDSNDHAFPPWSQLPSELLELVARRIARISDYIRFRSVCRSWRSAARPECLRPQPPLLMFPDRRAFFSLATRKVHAVSPPDGDHGAPRDKVALSAAHGWLIMLDVCSGDLSLLNPVTGAQRQLPSTAGFRRDRLFAWLPFLSSSPSSSSAAEEECVVMVLHCFRNSGLVAFCRPGRDEDWSVLRTGLPEKPSSIAYHRGKFFVIDQVSGNVHVCDAAAPSQPAAEVALLKAPRENHRFCLAKAGKELFLCGIRSIIPNLYSKMTLEIYALDFDGRLLWSEVKGDQCNNSFFLSASQFLVCNAGAGAGEGGGQHGCRGGCVYSSFGLDESLEEEEERCLQKVDVFSLKDGSCCGIIPCGWKVAECGNIPVWVTPSLC